MLAQWLVALRSAGHEAPADRGGKAAAASAAELGWSRLPLTFSQTINHLRAPAMPTCPQPHYLLLNKCISVNQEACFNYLIEELSIHALILNVQMFQ